MPPQDVRARAMAVIREYQNNAHSYIAMKLQSLGVPTLSGRGRWSSKTVTRLCNEAGIDARYRPQMNTSSERSRVA